MAANQPTWRSSPEKRVIKEIFLTKEGGIKPGDRSTSTPYGRVLETVTIRELQLLARQLTDADLRFSRGYIVEDYGSQDSEGLQIEDASRVEPEGPRFDIICYRGDVAWNIHDGVPHAIVPESFAFGAIEVKRTAFPSRFRGDTESDNYNIQLRRQREYLDELGVDIPQILLCAHFNTSSETEVRRLAKSDHVVLLGDLTHSGDAGEMAQVGELSNLIKLFADDLETPDSLKNTVDEKVEELQDIASKLTDKDRD